jgi:hypothetical protein
MSSEPMVSTMFTRAKPSMAVDPALKKRPRPTRLETEVQSTEMTEMKKASRVASASASALFASRDPCRALDGDDRNGRRSPSPSQS